MTTQNAHKEMQRRQLSQEFAQLRTNIEETRKMNRLLTDENSQLRKCLSVEKETNDSLEYEIKSLEDVINSYKIELARKEAELQIKHQIGGR